MKCISASAGYVTWFFRRHSVIERLRVAHCSFAEDRFVIGGSDAASSFRLTARSGKAVRGDEHQRQDDHISASMVWGILLRKRSPRNMMCSSRRRVISIGLVSCSAAGIRLVRIVRNATLDISLTHIFCKLLHRQSSGGIIHTLSRDPTQGGGSRWRPKHPNGKARSRGNRS